jgi:hypothetical protein
VTPTGPAQENGSTPDSSIVESRKWVGLVLTLLIAATLYGITLFPGVGGRVNVGDSAKFQYIGEILGVPHHPGYPQYVLLNHLWTRLPMPLSLATQVNLFSAFLSLIAAGFLYSTLWRLTKNLPASLLGTWCVLFARSVWAFSTEAEVYSLHLAYCAALLWAVVRFRQDNEPRWIIVLAVIFGLSLGNHPTSVLFLPGLAILALTPSALAWGKRKLVALALLALVIGLSQYTFLLWRSHSDAPFVEAIDREADLEDLGETLSGSRFTSKNVLRKGLSGVASRLGNISLQTIRQLWVLPVILAIPGLMVLFRKDKTLFLFMAISAVTFVVFISIYHIGDWVAYLAPIWLMIGILAGLGLARGLAARNRLGPVATMVWITTMAALIVVNATSLYVDQNRWERTWLLESAELSQRVVTYRGPGYRPRQLNNYYRYGVLHERPPLVLTAVEAIHNLAFLDDDPLIFSSAHVKKLFDRHRVQYSERWNKEGRMFYETISPYPIAELMVRPSRGRTDQSGGIRVDMVDGTNILDAEAPIQVAIIAGDSLRLKGAVNFAGRNDRLGEKGAKLETLLRRVKDDDWIILVVNEPYMATSKKVRRLLGNWAEFLIAPPPTADDGFLVIGKKGSSEPPWQLTDPTETQMVILESSD